MILRESTKEKHHAAERTPVGASMADGSISEQWWADWMGAITVIHMATDPYLDPKLRRTTRLCNDLAQLGVQPRHIQAAAQYAATLTDSTEREAAAYVFTGAHLMGGAVTHKALRGRLPATHLEWEDRQAAVREWKPLREREDLVEAADRAFGAVLAICNEITAHDAD